MILISVVIVMNLVRLSYQESDLVLIAQPGGSSLRLTCITRNVTRAITWDSKFAPEVSVPATDTPNRYAMNHGGLWERENSLTNTLGFILDDRWEKLETVISKTSHRTKFARLARINLSNKFEMPVSVKLELEGHIYICKDDEEPTRTDCYWFMLGTGNGTTSAIRKCRAGEIPITNKNPTGNCSINRNTVNKNPLAKNNWKHFIITFDNVTRTVSLKFFNTTKPFLKFQDEDYTSVKYRSVWVNSRDLHSGLWKLHDYDYYVYRSWREERLIPYIYTPKMLCISLYVAMCKSCTLILSVKNYDHPQPLHQETYAAKDSKWTNLRFKYFSNSTDGYYFLEAQILSSRSYDVSPFLAVDDVQQSRNCFEEEIKYSSIMIEKNYANSTFCQFLIGDEHKLRISDRKQHPVRNCSLDSIGAKCIKCSEISLVDCTNSLICEPRKDAQQCYCSAGSMGEFCEHGCSWSTFGVNCNQNCGTCKYDHCDGISGVCLSGCKNNYIGSKCQQAKLPVLKAGPTVDADCVTTCNITFNSSNYVGIERPYYFKLEYKTVSSNTWLELPVTPLDSNTIMVMNLIALTNYTARILLGTEDKKFYGEAPATNFSTSCKELTGDDVVVHAESHRAIFSIQAGRSTSTCNFGSYSIILMKDLVFRAAFTDVIIAYNLSSFQEYNYTIYNKHHDGIIIGKFKTDESAPGPVRHVTFTSKQAEISIKWLKPSNPNGVIKEFLVSYEHKKNIFCQSLKNRSSRRVLHTKHNHITIKNLIPYSIYTIKIQANNKYDGNATEVSVSTEATEELAPSSYNIFANSSANDVNLTLTPKCEEITSPVYMEIFLSCNEIWCSSRKKQIIKLPKGHEIISGLIPFSNYNLTITLSSNQNFRKPLVLPMIRFKTNATAPNQVGFFDVYAKNLTNLSLRWLPPYPPTGKIETFKLTYYVHRYLYNLKRESNVKCRIWQSMYCVTFKNLFVAIGFNSSIEIAAKNIGINEWSPAVRLNISNIENLWQPESLRAYWDDRFNLTVEWQHPNRTHGRIPDFLIRVASLPEYTYHVNVENLTYFFKIPIKTDKLSFNISVLTLSNGNKSPTADIIIKCPPPVPQLSQIPEIKLRKGDYLALEIPPSNDSRYNSSLYVVISKTLPNDTFAPYILTNGILNFTRGEWWIARECTVAEVKLGITIILGDDTKGYLPDLHSKFFNRKLEPGVKYKIYVVVYNKFMNQRRSRLYTIETSTLVETNNSLILILVIVLSLTAAAVLFFVLFRKFFKKKPVLNMQSSQYLYDEPIELDDGILQRDVSELANSSKYSYAEEHHYEDPTLLKETSLFNNLPEYANSTEIHNHTEPEYCSI